MYIFLLKFLGWLLALCSCVYLCASTRTRIVDGLPDPDGLPMPDPEVVPDPYVEQTVPLVQVEDNGPMSVDEMEMLDGLYQWKPGFFFVQNIQWRSFCLVKINVI